MSEPGLGGRERTELGARAAAELSPTALAIVDRSLVVVYANAAFRDLGLNLVHDDLLLATTAGEPRALSPSTSDLVDAIRSGRSLAAWKSA